MSIKIADRVKETSLTQGTGTLTLNGAFGGFQSFSSAIGDGNSTYYAIENESRWEVGIGTYTSSSNTLSRDTVLKSSSGTSKITISGVAIVFCSYPADKAIVRDENGDVSESGLLTLTRDSAGNFIHMYKDDSYDRTISIYTDGNASPEWRMGVKNSPSSETEAPSEGYVYGKDGQVGLVGNSSNSITLDNTTDFTVKHNNVSLVKASSLTGIHLNTNSASYPAITINGAAAQSQPLTEWTDSAGNVLSIVDKDGNIGVNRSSASYELDVTGSGRFTSVIFADATEQSTAYTNQEVAVSGWAEAYVDSQDHSAAAVSGWADSTMTTRDTAISGWARSYVDNQDHSGGGGSAADILANSASGVVISGIANTNVINIASNLVEIRANSASGVVISGIANTNSASISTNVTNIASNLVEVRANSASGVVISGIANTNAVAIDASGTYWLNEIRANSASGVVISGIANTNVTNIASNLVEVRANSASGVVISGIANTNVTNIASNLVEVRANSASGAAISGWANATFITTDTNTTYTAGSGLELHGTAFQAAISGANLLATNTPTDDYVPSYDAATGKLTWVANAGGGGATYTAGSGLVLDGDNKFHSTFASGNYLLGEVRDNSSSGVVISGIANTNVSNIASNLVEIRANSASGVVISGIANTNVTNIASNLVEVRSNSASGVVISGIANTNAVAINASGTYWLDEIRANSASGAAISGWANATFITTDTNTTYTAGSGLELHGTAFQTAISGANLLATNTPADNQLASYDAATGKFTWVSAGAGGENNEFSFKTISVAGQSDVVADTTTDTLTLAAGSNVTITTNAGTDTITIASTDTTYSEATDSAEGLMSTAHHDKLDGIEASADVTDTANVTAAGALMDSELTDIAAVKATEDPFTAALLSKLNAIEASADVTDATNVTAAGALMDSEVTNLATVKALASGISDGNFLTANDVVADDDFLRINGTEVEGRSASEVLSDIAAAPAAGSSSILTVGALDAGSITSGFGNIDNGGSSIACGSLDVSDGNITNVGDIDCDSISIDDAAVGLNIAFGGNTTLNKITLTDNLADALNVTEGSNSYIKICTTNAAGSTADAEKIHFGQATVGATHTDGSAQDASLSIDCSKGNYHEILLGNHDVTSVAFTNASAGQRIVVRFKNHSTAKDLGASAGWNSVTINGSSATLHWPGGTEPTLTDSNSAIDVYGFVFTSTVTTAYGFIIGQDIKA